MRPLRNVYAVDADAERARTFARAIADDLCIDVEATDDLRAAARASDIVVTCTPSTVPLLFAGFLAPGAFVAAIGADSEDKQEVDAALLGSVKLVTDVTAQCLAIGDLHHAVAAGLLAPQDVHAELGEIVAGRRAGRRTDDEIIVFDSTGMALQDVAAAAAVYEAALADGRGSEVVLSD